MTQVGPTQIRLWQEEVARDPGSVSFLPLAESYVRAGRDDVARRLCLRGLERNPDLVEGHHLLGRIYRKAGELEKAFDEWDIALRLDPDHRLARRALAFLCLELRDWTAAARHLEVATGADPADPRLAEALAFARARLPRSGHRPDPEPDPAERVGSVLEEPLARFVREARLRFLLLTDASGRILGQQGFSRDLDLASFASLGAGIHAASRSLAAMLGEAGFDQLFQGEGERQLFLGSLATPLGELLLLGTFGSESSIGLVRVAFRELLGATAAIAVWPSPARRSDARDFERSLQAGLHRAYRSLAAAGNGAGNGSPNGVGRG